MELDVVTASAHPKSRPDCKVDGCGQPRYVFPGGGRATYCAEHLKLRNSKQRNGLEPMSGRMKAILQYLREQHDQGAIFEEQVFVELSYPLAHGKTLSTLADRDWAFRSVSKIDGTTKYKITGRGLKALAAYEPARCRKDGICPDCGIHPRRLYSSGRMAAYCEDCDKALQCRKTARLRRQDTDASCCRCHKRPRHRYPGGTHSAYCGHCARINRRRNLRKHQLAIFKAVQAGGQVPMCKRCKQQPRIVYPNCVAQYCHDCKLEIEGKARARRKLARLTAASLFSQAQP